MSKYGPCHRTGEPGAPGCKLAALSITTRASDGSPIPAYLLNAEDTASELEMLRSIASGLGAKWGKDDLGWWAVVPRWDGAES